MRPYHQLSSSQRFNPEYIAPPKNFDNATSTGFLIIMEETNNLSRPNSPTNEIPPPELAPDSPKKENSSELEKRTVTLAVDDLRQLIVDCLGCTSSSSEYHNAWKKEKAIITWLNAAMDEGEKAKGCAHFYRHLNNNTFQHWNPKTLNQFGSHIKSPKAVDQYKDYFRDAVELYENEKRRKGYFQSGRFIIDPNMNDCMDAYFNLHNYAEEADVLEARKRIFSLIVEASAEDKDGQWINHYVCLKKAEIDVTSLTLEIIKKLILVSRTSKSKIPNWHCFWREIKDREDLTDELETLCHDYCSKYPLDSTCDVKMARYLEKSKKEEYSLQSKTYLMAGLFKKDKSGKTYLALDSLEIDKYQIDAQLESAKTLLKYPDCAKQCADFYMRALSKSYIKLSMKNILDNCHNEKARSLVTKELASRIIDKLECLVKSRPEHYYFDPFACYIPHLANIPGYEMKAFLILMDHIESFVNHCAYLSKNAINLLSSFCSLLPEAEKKQHSEEIIQTFIRIIDKLKTNYDHERVHSTAATIINGLLKILNERSLIQDTYNKSTVLQEIVFLIPLAIAHYGIEFANETIKATFLNRLQDQVRGTTEFHFEWIIKFITYTLQSITDETLLNATLDVILQNTDLYSKQLYAIRHILACNKEHKAIIHTKHMIEVLTIIKELSPLDDIQANFSSNPKYNPNKTEDLKKQATQLLAKIRPPA